MKNLEAEAEAYMNTLEEQNAPHLLFCAKHHVVFFASDHYRLTHEEELALRAAEVVATEHAQQLGCAIAMKHADKPV